MLKKICVFLCLTLGSASLALAAEGEGHAGLEKDFHSANPRNTAPMSAPQGPFVTAVVKEVMNGSGYSYLQLQGKGESFWLAGTQVNAKKGDTVRYVENVVMENFASRALNRTFDRIVFASSVEVVK